MSFVPDEINVKEPGAILVVGRDPGEQEVAQGRPFVGPSGRELERLLAEAGLPRSSVNIANVVRYRPPHNDFKQHDPRVVEAELERLYKLIEELKPSVILALGDEASYALVPGWPSSGKGIFGAKGITERRGFFWRTPRGLVFSSLHPAGVLRQPVPGYFLLKSDFRKVYRFLKGRLPIEDFPEVKPLTFASMHKLLESRYLAWDIETKWGLSAVSMIGFCADDYEPYVACGAKSIELYALPVLRSIRSTKVTHNGFGFDLLAMRLFYGLRVPNNQHDTQVLWWALEPELAGGEEGKAALTRKGLSFLASIFLNVPYWKFYPEEDTEEAEEQMFFLNGIDAWVTRRLFDEMWKMVCDSGLVEQYKLAIETSKALLDINLRGVPVNLELLEQRVAALERRIKEAEEQAKEAAINYLRESGNTTFAEFKPCHCCGGRSWSSNCWRCGGLKDRPKTKKGYAGLVDAEEFKKLKVGDLKSLLPACAVCKGEGKLVSYNFNPFSVQQLGRLLCGSLGAPRSVWKGKQVMDEAALRRIYRWSRG